MKRWALLIVVVLCLCGLAARLSPTAPRKQALAPLTVVAGGGSEMRALPDDALIVSLTDSTELVPPFSLREDPSAVGGVALVLPKGSGTKEHKGRAKVAVTVPERRAGETPAPPREGTGSQQQTEAARGTGAGAKYHAWARVYWRDSCSNSASLKVGDEPERDFGNDCVYNCWHWVHCGQYALRAGKVPVAVIEREEGIALDQLFFTRDATYMPLGPISRAGEKRGTRRFADDFGRSPGHGLGDWDVLGGKWYINFSFDPNRIPNQYTLVGEAPAAGTAAPQALALVQGAPWYGCKLAFSLLPMQDGCYGAVVDRSQEGTDALQIAFHLAAGQARLEVRGCTGSQQPTEAGRGTQESVDLTGALLLNQWHRVVIERWAWVTRVWLDGRMVFADYAAAPRVGRAGLCIARGTAAFDDVELEEVPWQADDGGALALPWVASADAKWFRAADGSRALIGHSGTLSASLPGMGLEEAVLEGLPGKQVSCAVLAPGLDLSAQPQPAQVLVWRRPEFPVCAAPANATLQVAGSEACVRRVAFRYGERTRKTFLFGPYHFAQSEVPDPSDYLDFTKDELKQMAQSPDADKFARRQKMIPLVGEPADETSMWIRENGHWKVHDGVLQGTGPDAVLRHALELSGDVDFHCRVRLAQASCAAAVEFYAGAEPGVRAQVAAGKVLWLVPAGAAVNMPMPADEKWHDLHISITDGTIVSRFDKDPAQEGAAQRRGGSRILLRVLSGSIEFDDIEFSTPRYTADGSLYAFQQQEPDWWREGTWVDHGGNACVLASNWVSLVQPQGTGMLWNKRSFGPDMMVGFDIEESSDWFGWNKPGEGHVHHPFDNICAILAPVLPDKGRGDVNLGYRLEVNTEKRSATILFRNGKEVARVAQDAKFPIKYRGGHGPYFPRRNHVTLAKRGPIVRALINGKEVLRFTDPEPLAVCTVGVGGYDTRANFGHIEVRRLEKPAPGAAPTDASGGF